MKISVALTTYNGSKYLCEQLESLVTQSVLPDEIIICDDGSNDNTLNILNDYCNKYSGKIFIRIIVNEKNMGWRANFRKALELCSGDLIFLCDQDDIWVSDKINDMVRIVNNNPKIMLLTSNYSYIVEDDSDCKRLPSEVKNSDEKVLLLDGLKYYGHVIRPGCTFCFKRNLVEILKKIDIPDYGHDCALWHIALTCGSLWTYNKVLIKQRLHSEHSSKSNIPIGITRRIDELKRSVKMCEYANDVAQLLYSEDNLNAIKMMNYYKKRIELIQNASFLHCLIYNIMNWNKATSVRNILGDNYVLLKKSEK